MTPIGFFVFTLSTSRPFLFVPLHRLSFLPLHRFTLEYRMNPTQYTAIIRKSKLEYVAVCLELNVSARGVDLADVERNLRAAIELYLADVEQFPETVISPVSTEDLIEFLADTTPEWFTSPPGQMLLRALEVHEVPSYA